MNRAQKWMSALIGVVFVSLAVTSVTASPGATSGDTLLYTFRMEQVSSEMNFLPTERNDFIYTSEKGYELDYDVRHMVSEPDFYIWTYYGQNTCSYGPDICLVTYYYQNTCPITCRTCWDTCRGYTCPATSCLICPWITSGVDICVGPYNNWPVYVVDPTAYIVQRD